MERVCFRLKVRLERLDEYVERHRRVWPDMREALSASGWTNYSLFLDHSDGTLIGYLETPDLAAAQAGMAATEVNARWQRKWASSSRRWTAGARTRASCACPRSSILLESSQQSCPMNCS